MSEVAIIPGRRYTKCGLFDAAFQVIEVDNKGIHVVWYRRGYPDWVYGTDYVEYNDTEWHKKLIEVGI